MSTSSIQTKEILTRRFYAHVNDIVYRYMYMYVALKEFIDL